MREKSLDSPNGKFACKIKKITELNKSAFGTRSMFTDRNGKLIYYKKGTYLHELGDSFKTGTKMISSGIGEFYLVQWSETGDSVYFLQYSIKNGSALYINVVIEFLNKRLFLIEDSCFKAIGLNFDLMRPFNLEIVEKKLAANKILPNKLDSDELSPLQYYSGFW
jgi:hypothetical protein